jgi:catechol 2,3-dioxygenase-like lactoylglutathione lyase family enzyme
MSRHINPVLHHVAVVVADLDEALARYQALGFSGGERFELAEQAVEVATLRS